MKTKLLLALFVSFFASVIPRLAAAQCDDVDHDSDGVSCRAGDCNDFDNTVYPGAPELCDGKDNNCDGIVDNPPDGDGDGVDRCHGDCDDADPRRFPGNPEVCDGKDNDCNPATMDSMFTRPCYTGPGGTQGVGICHGGTETCNGPTGWSGTCANQVTPAASDPCDGRDNNCNGMVDEGFDQDHDNFTTCNGDCNDNDPAIHPGATEVCDNVDNNCDGHIDNRDPAGDPLQRACYDGAMGTQGVGLCHGGMQDCVAGVFATTCTGEVTPVPDLCDGVDRNCDGIPYSGLANADMDPVPACAGDCNDNDPTIYPGAPEVCDGKDNDCDGHVDNRDPAGDPLQQACYDGPAGTQNVGLCRGGMQLCTSGTFSGTCMNEVLPGTDTCDGMDRNCDGRPFSGLVNADNDPVPAACGDCNDNDPTVYPGAPEICDGKDNNCDGRIDENFDMDGDGFTICNGDCNDNNPSIYPGAPEVCNGIDDNCNGQIDEGFPDVDMDGYHPCGPRPDCDDNDPTVHPDAPELCDGKDNNCDGLVDNRNARGDPLQRSCYDGPAGTNGIGPCHSGTVQCTGGTFNNPCMGEVVPTAEVCNRVDDNCDGHTDENFDQDHDGFTTCALQPDCNDMDPAIHPGAMEVCDGKDNDCDGHIDNRDAQGDPLRRACYDGPSGTNGVGICHSGFNLCMNGAYATTCTGEVVPASSDPCDHLDNNCNGTIDEGFDQDHDGYTSCNGDCNDNDPTIHPGAMEICDNKDNNCDGTVDGAMTDCYTGPAHTATIGLCHPGRAICTNGTPGMCNNQQLPVTEICDHRDNDCDGKIDNGFDQDNDGVTTCGGDCDDHNPFVAPNLPEQCDCIDNNCNMMIDEDGHGGSVCQQGACHDFDTDGYTNCDGDCDDHDAKIYPGAPEIYGNGKDDNCNGVIDEIVDEDHDGYTTQQGDCDDRFANIHPGAPEVCDGFDNNCDGQIDEGFDEDHDFATTCAGDCDDHDPLRSPFRQEICGNHIDDDCDGIVDNDTDNDGDGVSTCQGDCNDYNTAVHPGAIEVCDGQDNNCNHMVDEGFDQDHDGFTTCGGDCNDHDPTINPNAREIPNDHIDNNCNGQVDEGENDADGDGFSYLCGDCNDSDPSIGPNQPEICDGKDNNCDGIIDRTPQGQSVCGMCQDADRDGVTTCMGDCNDFDPTIHPGATEVCDGVDNDCDGTIDLEPGTRVNLCTLEDAGMSLPDAGSGNDDGGPGGDSGSLDSGTSGQDASNRTQAAATGLAIKCGCSTTTGERGQGRTGIWFLAMLGAGFAARRIRRSSPRAVFVARRARRARAIARVLALFSMSACSRLEVGPAGGGGQDAGGSTDRSSGSDGGGGDDARAERDVGGGTDGESIDYGSNVSGPCRLDDRDSVSVFHPHGLPFQFAIDRGFDAHALSGVTGLALEDRQLGIFAFAIRTTLDPSIDLHDIGAPGQVIARVLQPIFQHPIPGVIGAANRIDETLVQAISHRGNNGSRALKKVTWRNAVDLAHLRDGVLSQLAHVPMASIGGLPDISGDPPVTILTLAAYAEVSTSTNTVDVVVAMIDESRTASATTKLEDLTNSTHLGLESDDISIGCKTSTAGALKVDFVWVIDDSASMQEEQAAIAAAADGFFEALGRSRIDFRIGVVTTDGEVLRGNSFTNDLDTFKARVRVGINGNGREEGLEYGVRALARAKTATRSEERLRSDAVTVVVFVSDEDSTNIRPLDDLIGDLRQDNALPFAIVGPRPFGCVAVGRGIARAGDDYIKVAETLHGLSASICSEDLTGPIQQILLAAAGAASLSQLDDVPISGSLEVSTATRSIAHDQHDGFDYEPSANSILFFGSSAPRNSVPFRTSYLKFIPFHP